MFRIYLIIIILHLGLIFQGCAALEYFDGSSKEEIKKLKMTKEEIFSEMEKLKIENANLKKQINILRKENKAIRDESENKIARMRDKEELLHSQINKSKEENQKISKENQDLYEKIADLRLKYQTLLSKRSRTQKKLVEPEKDIRKFKIKVLSGDGDLNFAKEIAKKLRSIGYKIKLIDQAPRSNFLRNTVFFAPRFQNEAKQLASRLDGNTISKALSWSSVFDLIVVTGKNP